MHAGEISGPWGPEMIHALRAEDLEDIFLAPPELLLLGTGRKTTFPPPEILDALSDAHIPFECMDSRACARTYNLLLGEGRKVSAAVLLPSADSQG